MTREWWQKKRARAMRIPRNKETNYDRIMNNTKLEEFEDGKQGVQDSRNKEPDNKEL